MMGRGEGGRRAKVAEAKVAGTELMGKCCGYNNLATF